MAFLPNDTVIEPSIVGEMSSMQGDLNQLIGECDQLIGIVGKPPKPTFPGTPIPEQNTIMEETKILDLIAKKQNNDLKAENKTLCMRSLVKTPCPP